MTSRSILNVFEQYQKARLAFVQSVSDLALKPQNIELLDSVRVLDLIKPLLTDISPQIQQCAAIALGRLVHCDANLAGKALNEGFLPLLLNNLHMQSKRQKKAFLFVLRSICRHDPQLARYVVAEGGLTALVISLEDFESSVKESAAWAVGYIARHNQSLAQECVNAGAVPLLILGLQEPDLTLKQICASAISDIAKHSITLGQAIIDAGGIPHLAKNLNNLDEKLKRQILCALSSCAKHSTELAEAVVEAEVFPSVLIHMAHVCPAVRVNAACLVRDVVKHSVELTQLVVNTGGIRALMESLYNSTEEIKVPVITALGYIAGQSDQLAMSVLGCNSIIQFAEVLNECKHDAVLSVTVWTLGQLGKHTPNHSQCLAAANIFPQLLTLYNAPESSEDLKYKCKVALKLCLQKCLLTSSLDPLLKDAPPSILKYILGQYSKVLPHDPQARRLFVTSGGLKKIQEIDAQVGSTLMEYITIINSCFPEEIVRYYSPGYPDSLLQQVEQYSPQMMSVLRDTNVTDSIEQTNDETTIESQSIQNIILEQF